MSENKKVAKLELDFTQVTRTKSILNQNQVQKLWNATPKRYLKVRPAKGGGEWDYVRIGYVRQVLDSVFGFDWSFEVETTLAESFEIAKITKVCVVKGTLTARVEDAAGRLRDLKKTQFGRAEVKFKKNSTELLDFGNDLKAATTDCLKKCASLFGIAADIYEKDEFMEITIKDADVNSDRAKATKERLDSLKKEMKVEEVPNEN